MIVIDASIAVKWLLSEADSEQAFDFLKTYQGQLASPDLLSVEVAGAIVRKANREKSFYPDALKALEKWARMISGRLIPSYAVNGPRLLQASRMALQLGHPLKDCTYLALAIELGGELATCDVKFRDRAAAFYPGVRLLSDYV